MCMCMCIDKHSLHTQCLLGKVAYMCIVVVHASRAYVPALYLHTNDRFITQKKQAEDMSMRVGGRDVSNERRDTCVQ